MRNLNQQFSQREDGPDNAQKKLLILIKLELEYKLP